MIFFWRFCACRSQTPLIRFNSAALRHIRTAPSKEQYANLSDVLDRSVMTHPAVAPQSLGPPNEVDQVGVENRRADTIRRKCKKHTDPIPNGAKNLEEEAPRKQHLLIILWIDWRLLTPDSRTAMTKMCLCWMLFPSSAQTWKVFWNRDRFSHHWPKNKRFPIKISVRNRPYD